MAEQPTAEELHDAAAKANEALERIGEQARERIVDLSGWLRYALEHWAPGGSDKAERARAALERAEAETPAPPLAERYRMFTALRDELYAACVCLACGTVTPGRRCQCENDE